MFRYSLVPTYKEGLVPVTTSNGSLPLAVVPPLASVSQPKNTNFQKVIGSLGGFKPDNLAALGQKSKDGVLLTSVLGTAGTALFGPLGTAVGGFLGKIGDSLINSDMTGWVMKAVDRANAEANKYSNELDKLNAYIKYLYMSIYYYKNIRKWEEYKKLIPILSAFENKVKSSGYGVIGNSTAYKTTSRGNFTYGFPIYKRVSSKVVSPISLPTKPLVKVPTSFNSGVKTNLLPDVVSPTSVDSSTGKKTSYLWLILLLTIVPFGLYLLIKKIKK